MRTSKCLLALSALAVTVAACGGSIRDTTTTIRGPDHAHTENHDMGDPYATPAHEIAGAEHTMGPFISLGDRGSISGEAAMARHDDGTTVTLELVGLQPDADYISHVHQASCAEEGGPHYKFDPNGDHHPPNEIHLAFTSDASGRGFMTAENQQVATAGAVSVVVHMLGDNSPKVACADLATPPG